MGVLKRKIVFMLNNRVQYQLKSILRAQSMFKHCIVLSLPPSPKSSKKPVTLKAVLDGFFFFFFNEHMVDISSLRAGAKFFWFQFIDMSRRCYAP